MKKIKKEYESFLQKSSFENCRPCPPSDSTDLLPWLSFRNAASVWSGHKVCLTIQRQTAVDNSHPDLLHRHNLSFTFIWQSWTESCEYRQRGRNELLKESKLTLGHQDAVFYCECFSTWLLGPSGLASTTSAAKLVSNCLSTKTTYKKIIKFWFTGNIQQVFQPSVLSVCNGHCVRPGLHQLIHS